MSYVFINAYQSADQRREKYWYCRHRGQNGSWARKMRSWRWTTIRNFFKEVKDEVPTNL